MGLCTLCYLRLLWCIECQHKVYIAGWLKRADSHCLNEAYCKVCRKALRAHATDLQKHALTREHTLNMGRFNTARKITSDFKPAFDIKEKTAVLKIAAYIACHSAVRSVNHLCEIMKELGKGSSLENFRMHRTKCGNLMKHVIAISMLRELVEDVADMPYSLIVDESTDVSTFKYLCLCIKYFSKCQKQIVTDYLGIIAVISATADDLYASVKQFLDGIGLNMTNMVGIGTDGGSNLCGKNHSLYTLLRQSSPHLQLVRCVCHSLDNCSSKASEEFPASADFLLREIPGSMFLLNAEPYIRNFGTP